MVTFLQDDDGWACMAGSRTLGRISETPDGYVLSVGTHQAETFADIDDAQARVLDMYEPRWRPEAVAAVPDAPMAEAGTHARTTPETPRPPHARRKSPWKGGPKEGTKYARALAICEKIRSRNHFLAEDRWDNRGRSRGHAEAYDLASQAASLLGEAQGMSGHAACRRIEGNLRGRAARLLAKAEALMPEVRRIDSEALEALLADLDGERHRNQARP